MFIVILCLLFIECMLLFTHWLLSAILFYLWIVVGYSSLVFLSYTPTVYLYGNMISHVQKCSTCSWINILINQSELRDNFSENICLRHIIRVRCFYTFVNQLSFPTDFRNKLWVGLG